MPEGCGGSEATGIWSQERAHNKKEARAKRVFTSVCERRDRFRRACRRDAAGAKRQESGARKEHTTKRKHERCEHKKGD
ncbi:hypothetical protein OCV99_10580 [Dorea acetigenes]|uniref:Uncharacterized protein n=1 Tax=Dorea acetigenes TaxID=2981787 RepID=A0ABT2RNJ4_9FIRM|nr:hypothetical protein [Dorea acetigenes]MCU6686988.1 hypothetical protein [Dorea acetigenes]